MSVDTLVVLGSTLTALAVVRVAAKSGMRCVMLDNVAGPAAASRLAEFRQLPARSASAIVAATPDLVGRSDVAVIADSDHWLRFICEDRSGVEATAWRILHPQTQALEICLDKSAFLLWCSRNQLDAPKLYDEASAESLGAEAYPLMLRPEWTQHSTPSGLPKAIEVRDRNQLRYWVERYAAASVVPNICESLLSDGLRQFSVCAARNAAGHIKTFLAEKVRPHAHQCAGGTFVAPAEHTDVEAFAARALHALEFLGVAEVEVLLNPASGRMSLVEVNARPWLQYGLPFACGCDLLAHVLGRQSAAQGASSHHAWIHFVSDLRICFSPTDGLVWARKVKLRDYVRDLLRADVHVLFDRRDPAPLLQAMRKALTRAR